MINKQKSGITITSLVVYIVVFSVITVVLSMVYTNMNDTLFMNRGTAINYTTFNKLQYNITKSAVESTSITVSGNSINYSNGDSYVYIPDKNMILLNGGVICASVDSFVPTLSETEQVQKLTLDLTFNKYSAVLSKSIICSIEVN